MGGFFSRLLGRKSSKIDYDALLENGAVLLDVRSKSEYKDGHTENSVNIPLDSLGKQLSKLNKDKPIIAVCQSGGRSRIAVSLLKSNGFSEVYNGGSWYNFR